MPDHSEPPPPLPAPATPASTPREPVPGWMWLLFGAGPVAAGALLSGANTLNRGLNDFVRALLMGGVLGLGFSLPLAGGLALAGRFFRGNGGRIVGGLIFAVLLLVALGAVAFAGCMCLFKDANFR